MSHHTPEDLIKLLDEWLVAEDDTISMTTKISSASGNETIKLFMDIIRTDSAKHKRIQEYLKKSMTVAAPALAFDEIAEISGMINDHLALEQKTVDLGELAVSDIKLPIQKALFEYLVEDERKHVQLLNALAGFKEFAQKNT